MSFFENTRKPEGFGGEIMVAMMNFGHRALARWGMKFLTLPADGKVLDCGGGANIQKLLKKMPAGRREGNRLLPRQRCEGAETERAGR